MEIDPEEWDSTMTLPPEPSPYTEGRSFEPPPVAKDTKTSTTTTLPDDDVVGEGDLNEGDLKVGGGEGEEGSGDGGGGDDIDNPFIYKSKPLPLITGNDDDVEVDGPDNLPVLDDPYLTLKVGADDIEETEPITRRDRARSEAGERDATLAGLAFASHLALHSTGIVREDSYEGGLNNNLVPATPPPTPLSRTSSTSSQMSVSILNSNLNLPTVSEEGIGADGQVDEDSTTAPTGLGVDVGSSSNGLISGGSMVINPPNTPMAGSSSLHVSKTLKTGVTPIAASHMVPMTPPTTPLNRTSGTSGAGGLASTLASSLGIGTHQKPTTTGKKQEAKRPPSVSTSLPAGVPPPTPPVTPANRTGFGHALRPPPIVSSHTGDPAPTPPPTPMSSGGGASSLLRVSTSEPADSIIPSMSPQVRSRSSSADTYGTGPTHLEIQGHLSHTLLAQKFSNLSLTSPTGDEPPTPTATSSGGVVSACRVFDCNGRAFLRGYCAKHWRLAKHVRTESDLTDQEIEKEIAEEEAASESAPTTISSEYVLAWLASDDSGESHWKEWKATLTPSSSSAASSSSSSSSASSSSSPSSSSPATTSSLVYESAGWGVKSVILQEFLPKTDIKVEASPAQLITILAGTFVIHAGDGKSKTFTVGQVILLQDHSRKGHRITTIGSGKHRLSRAFLS